MMADEMMFCIFGEGRVKEEQTWGRCPQASRGYVLELNKFGFGF